MDKYRKLDMDKIRSREHIIITSSEEALRDIIPIDWVDDVLSGKVKVIIGHGKFNN